MDSESVIYSWFILKTACINICFGCINEKSSWDISFMRPKLMFDRKKNLKIIIEGGGGGGGGGGIYSYVCLPIFQTIDNLK